MCKPWDFPTTPVYLSCRQDCCLAKLRNKRVTASSSTDSGVDEPRQRPCIFLSLACYASFPSLEKEKLDVGRVNASFPAVSLWDVVSLVDQKLKWNREEEEESCLRRPRVTATHAC